MEAYKILDDRMLIIENDSFLYQIIGFKKDPILDSFQGYNDGVIVDKFEIVNGQLQYLGVMFAQHGADPLALPHLVKRDYLNRKDYPKINPKQLLTHFNPHLREIIKKILDGNL